MVASGNAGVLMNRARRPPLVGLASKNNDFTCVTLATESGAPDEE